MKKVLIFGLLGISNYGDNLIPECVQYMVNLNDNVESTVKDFVPKMNIVKKSVYHLLFKISDKNFINQAFKDKLVWKVENFKCRNYYEKLIKENDYVILGSGSFKYGTQRLWAYYSIAVEVAKKYNKPIMFNAMNIQKYDSASWKCRFLSEHANYKNVRLITSRDGDDGVIRLRKEYKINKHIKCFGVGDSAYWIPECYGVLRNTDSNVVGINLIDGDTFIRYGYNTNQNTLLKMYFEILEELDKAGVKWQLFTNGLPKDREFGEELLKLYGDSSRRIIEAKSAKNLVEIVSEFKTVFGARLHACITAYALDIPIVGFVWDEKMAKFAKVAGIEDSFFYEEGFKEKNTVQSVINMLLNGYCYDCSKREKMKQKTLDCISIFLQN